MKIMVNALSARRGGGQTYLQQLLENFPEDSDNEIILLAPKEFVVPFERSNIHRLDLSDYLIEHPIIRTIWEMFVLPKIINRLDVDVLFCPGGSVSGNIPVGCKVATTFQNMMPFDLTQRRKYPMGYMRFRNWALHKKLLSSMLKSDLVIFISEHAKSIIEQQSNNKIKKSIVIPHGVNRMFRRHPDHFLSRPSWLPSKGYLLYVSILDVYKAQVEVIEAYILLRRKFKSLYKLVLVGPEYEPYGKKVRAVIATHGLENDVLLKESISNTELPAVYQNASVNIFASETENCPFILLEALAAGRPLLVSNRPPMPEFGGEAVLYFDPGQPSDLANKLSILLENRTLMNKLSAMALKHSFKYDWADAAKNTWDSILGLTSK